MMVEPVVQHLSKACRTDLLRTLKIRLSTRLDLPGEETEPPGAIDYRANFYLTWYSDDGREEDSGVLQSIAGRGCEVDDGIRFEVGSAHFVLADLLEPDLSEALDAREGDLDYLGAVLFQPSDDGGYEIEDELLAPGSHAVLVNLVRIDPIWRGMKLGLLSTGTALRELSRGCSFAALDAMEPGASGETRRRSAHKRLNSYWRQLGFEPWRERVMVLDLTSAALDDRMAELVKATN